jgi:hypothetical protein
VRSPARTDRTETVPAERVGFEPTKPCGLLALQASRIVHSRTSPCGGYYTTSPNHPRKRLLPGVWGRRQEAEGICRVRAGLGLSGPGRYQLNLGTGEGRRTTCQPAPSSASSNSLCAKDNGTPWCSPGLPAVAKSLSAQTEGTQRCSGRATGVVPAADIMVQ